MSYILSFDKVQFKFLKFLCMKQRNEEKVGNANIYNVLLDIEK